MSQIDYANERVTFIIEIPVLDAAAYAGAQHVADQLSEMFGFVATRVERKRRVCLECKTARLEADDSDICKECAACLRQELA